MRPTRSRSSSCPRSISSNGCRGSPTPPSCWRKARRRWTDYVAFLPIWIKTKERKNGEMYNVVHMGGNHFANYTGFICRPEWAEQALPALGEKIGR